MLINKYRYLYFLSYNLKGNMFGLYNICHCQLRKNLVSLLISKTFHSIILLSWLDKLMGIKMQYICQSMNSTEISHETAFHYVVSMFCHKY